MKRLLKLLLFVGVVCAVAMVVMRATRRAAPELELEDVRWEPPQPRPEPVQPAEVEAEPAMVAETPRVEAELEVQEPGLEPEPHMPALEVEHKFETEPEEIEVDVTTSEPVEAEVGPEPHMPALDASMPVGEAAQNEPAGAGAEHAPTEADVQFEADDAANQRPDAFAVAEIEIPRPIDEAQPATADDAVRVGEPATAEPAGRPGEADLLRSVEEALTDLSPMPIIPPPRRNAESYLDEGNVYFNVGQYGLAVERYTQAIELDPELVAAYYNRANARTRAGEFEAALGDYDMALRLQPNDADALNNRGMLHLYRANYNEALRDFNGALAADPTDTTVMVNRGLAHLHGGDPANALLDFREAATMDPADAAAHYGAAQAAASLEDKSEALRHIGLALQYDAGYAREAAGDPRLTILQGDEGFLRLLRESGTRSS